MDRGPKIALWCVALWILGLVIINRILALSGSLYPMLDAHTPNPRYSEGLHNLLLPVAVGWSILCIVIGHLWNRATKASG